MQGKTKNILKKSINIFLRPILEPVIELVGEDISIADHRRNQKRLVGEIRDCAFFCKDDVMSGNRCFLPVLENLIGLSAEVIKPGLEIGSRQSCGEVSRDNFVAMLNGDLGALVDDGDLQTVIWQLMVLEIEAGKSGRVTSLKLSASVRQKVEALSDSASWLGSAEEVRAAHILSRLSLFGLSIGCLDEKYVFGIMSRLTMSMRPEDWFRSGEAIYGSSFMLRALLMLCRVGFRDQLVGYVDCVRESLLRKVEIRRESIFKFEGCMLKDSSMILEQVRFVLAILEISVIFDDLRFLNAGLKANDRLFSFLNKKVTSIDKGNIFQNILIALHYCQAIDIQEEKYSSLLCQT